MQKDGLSLPLQLKNGVAVEALGAVDPRPTFSTPLSLMTPGFRAVFKDAAAGTFVSEIKSPPGAKHPQFVVSLVADPQALAAIAEHHSSAAAGRTSVPGLSEQQQHSEGANSLKGCWGKAMFGLADADVLALLEALPGADATPNYQFVDERGGWDKEREFLAKGRWAKRSTLQAGMKKPAGKTKQQGQGQAGSPAAAARAALSTAAPGDGGGAAAAAPRSGTAAAGVSRKRPLSGGGGGASGGGGAAAAAASDSVLFAPAAASKRYKGMPKEEREVAGAVDHVLDKMIRKLEVWWGHETARESKKVEKAQARAAAQEAKKAAKEAAKAEGAAAAGPDAAAAGAAVQEIFGAVSGATFDTASMKAAQLRDLRTATPYVDITTWPEAARRYLAAAATATFLAQGEPKSVATGSSAKELDLPGHLRCMEAQDWAQYLCGGLNMKDLVSRVALLPQGSSETAAECLMMLDDASALAAAEQQVQQLAKAQQQQQQQDGASGADAMQIDAAGGEQQPGSSSAEQQLLGRRLLQALVAVWGDKSKNSSGTRMCFYAQELNPKLGRARGLDLHSVAARLEQGLYAATGTPLQALAADVVLACDLWRDAFNTFDMSREEGFRTADSRLADAVEERLQQLLADAAAGSNLAAAAGLVQEQQGPGSSSGPEGQAEAAAAAAAAVGEAGQGGGAEGQPEAAAATAEGQGAAGAAADAMDVDGTEPQQQQQQQQPAASPAAAPAPSQQQQQHVPSTSNNPSPQRQQQQQDVAPAEGNAEPEAEPEEAEEAEHTDPHGLQDPKRPYNPLAGCRVCWKEDDKAKLLLCDGCNDEYHCYCVTPALLDVPEGDWYCPLAGSSSSSDAAAWSRPGMCYIRELVGTAQRLGAVAYGAWPAAARLDLLVLLCEMLAASNTGRRFVEERMEAKREAKRHTLARHGHDFSALVF
ncbi:hypothetical protein OEZ85_003088 [Tetradesmus obliquus]|uniref:PHD-type domain-containing protein n=1 Tax=Tetradesmus obliquus TaxID=3088 RepID=A0ABY8TZI6_TETOB|nr:hypothetical protein OEZ85_003088 [Tetradesmus obliquus]